MNFRVNTKHKKNHEIFLQNLYFGWIYLVRNRLTHYSPMAKKRHAYFGISVFRKETC